MKTNEERGMTMQWKSVVDRFEEDLAVVLVGEEEIAIPIPRSLLPPKVKEGDHLRTTWSVDDDATSKAKERVTSLLDQLVNRTKQQD